MSRAKRNTLLLLSTAGILLLVLAMSLPNLVLFQGESFSLGQVSSTAIADAASTPSDIFVVILQGFVAISLILLPIYIIYSLMSRRGRQRLILNLIMLALVFALAEYLREHPLSQPQQPQQQAVGQPPQNDLGSGPPTVTFTNNPPVWLTIAIIVGLSALVVIVGAIAYLLLRRREPPDIALAKLAETAQTAITAIQSGGDFRRSVILCYQEMMRVVREQKGIARGEAMTVREFEDQLVRRGLPREAVTTLTRLFEQVRYGSIPSTTSDQELAVASLNDIIKACGGSYAE